VTAAHRLVADPLPGLAALAELVDDPADLAELIALRNASDPVARHAASLATARRTVPLAATRHPPSLAAAISAAGDYYEGARAPLVMAPFLWFGQSRFSPGTFGVLYAASTV
jgi:hypothetical protein